MNLRITPKFNTLQNQQRSNQNNIHFTSTLSDVSTRANKILGEGAVEYLQQAATKYCGTLDRYVISDCENLHYVRIKYHPNSRTQRMQEKALIISKKTDAEEFMQEQHSEFIKHNEVAANL